MSKRGRRGTDSTTPKPPTVEFFKIFLPHNLTTHKLLIPPDYVKHFSRTIQERITLKDGGGESWDVEVEKTLDGIFITGEWKSFASHHCLTVGDFLYFRYEGCYFFEVKMFGTNGCSKGNFSAKNIETHVKIEKEVDEPELNTFKKARHEEVSGLRGKSRTDLSRAAVKDKPNEKKPRVYDVDEPELNTCTQARVDEDEIRLREGGRKELSRDAGAEKYRLNGKKSRADEIDEPELSTCKTARVDEEEIQLRAKSREEISRDAGAEEDGLNKKKVNSKSSGNCKGVENGDSAVMGCPYIIQPPSKSPQYRLRIPETISDRRDINFKSEMILRNAHGREWPVRFYKSDDGGTYIGRGLFEFRKQNIVGFEDSCKFTFNTNSNVIDVQILRSMKQEQQQSAKKLSGSWQWEAFPIS